LGIVVGGGSGRIRLGWGGCWRPGELTGDVSAAIALFLSTITEYLSVTLSSSIPLTTTAQFKLMTPASPPQNAYSLQNAFK
jgi:hypothetical protein